MTAFSKKTIPFLTKAGKQRDPEWLKAHQAEYEKLVKVPFVELAVTLKKKLLPAARGYHFPTKGIGRLKRPAHKVDPGEAVFKDWLSLAAARPSGNRFERNPYLFFGILPNLPDWKGVIVAGGLYLPSGPQIKSVRQAIAADASPFHELFGDRAFKARFKSDFATSEKSTRAPRGFDADHPDMEWLKLRSFHVFKKLSIAEFTSPKLAESLSKDFAQLLRLNALLERATSGAWISL